MDALEEFLERFASKNAKYNIDFKPETTGVATGVTTGTGLKPKSSFEMSTNQGLVTPSEIEMFSKTNAKIDELNNTEDSSDFANGVSKGLSVLPEAAQLYSNAKGGQFQSSVESGGPGNPTGGILSGMGTGASVGSVAGPWGAAAGAVVGGVLSAFGHSKQKKKYEKNVRDFNEKRNHYFTKQLEQEYHMSKGLESLESLKHLMEQKI